jgi:hypothetical protein
MFALLVSFLYIYLIGIGKYIYLAIGDRPPATEVNNYRKLKRFKLVINLPYR